jgi:DNA-binding XRE family transcriptional regulator
MSQAPDETTKIYNRITLFRAEAGMSRKALADAVGVNPQTIGYLERGDYYPSLELGMKLGRTFGVPVEALFSFTPFEPVASLLQRTREFQ